MSLKNIIQAGDLRSISLNKSRLNEINSISLVLKTLIIELIEKEIITLEDFIIQLNKIDIEDGKNDGKSDINQLLRWLELSEKKKKLLKKKNSKRKTFPKKKKKST